MNTETQHQITGYLPPLVKRRLMATLALRGETYTHWLHVRALDYIRACEEEERAVVQPSAEGTRHE